MYKIFNNFEARGESRWVVFDDLLNLGIQTFSASPDMSVIDTLKGRYGLDRMNDFMLMLDMLVKAVPNGNEDVLGDFFMGAISFGEHGQYFTPENVCYMMAAMLGTKDTANVLDPCCGSGRMLLAHAKLDSDKWFIGQDIDHRCVKMTTLNLAIRNLKGTVICGNSLKVDVDSAYDVVKTDLGSVIIEASDERAEAIHTAIVNSFKQPEAVKI